MSADVTHYCGRCLTTFTSDLPSCPNLSCGSSQPDVGWANVLQAGDLLDRHYRVERALAVGGAGITYLAREVDEAGELVGPKVAVKVLYVDRAAGGFLRRLSIEAQILQDLAHEHIVRLRGFVQRAGREPYLVTLFEEGGNLAEHVERVGPLPPFVAAATVRQVLLALDVAHQRGVVHRDLKPDNVLLSEQVDPGVVPHVRVADFGIAKVAGGADNLTRVGGFVGTPEYAAPEQFEGKPPTPATDVYAAGGLLLFLLTGRPPFRFSSRRDLGTTYDEILAQLPPRIDRSQVRGSPAAVDVLETVLEHTLVADPTARFTISRILQELAPLLGIAAPGQVSIDLTHPGPTPRARTAPETMADVGGFADEPTDPDPGTAVPPPLPIGAAPAMPRLPIPAAPPPLPPGVRRPTAPPAAVRQVVPPPPPVVEVPPEATVEIPTEREVEPPRVVPVIPPPPVDVEPARGRSLVASAGCMGVSLVGILAVGGGSLAVLTVALVAIGWAAGWFAPSPAPEVSVVAPVPGAPPPAPTTVDPALATRFAQAPVLAEVDVLQVQRAARGVTNAIERRCGSGAQVLAEVLVDKSGQALLAKVDVAESRLGSVTAACVESGLLHVNVPNGLTREGRAPVSLRLR